MKFMLNIEHGGGYHRIADSIRIDTGLVFSDLLIHKVCKENNIYSKARKKPYKHPNEEHIVNLNAISGNWITDKPFRKNITNTTIFWNKGSYYDLTMYIDVFNNEIVAYDLSNSKHGVSTSNHMKAQKSLIKTKIKRGYINSETIVHSDQGVIYSSAVFNNAFKDYNISRYMSRRATPTDNPISESIN